jgi:glycerol-3-phosphate acyltransferase PlsX
LRIAVDIMGGDFAPQVIVEGAVKAATENPQLQIILVGKSEVLQTLSALPNNVSTVMAATVMGMDEPVENLMGKKDSSIWVASKLVKDGAADAVVSAGSTAAQMACGLLLFGRIAGISRPALATVIPTARGGKILLDVGANADCTALMLLQFALMGDIYAKIVLGIDDPQVALLSNGSEAGKGNKLAVEAHNLLEASGVNFIGNREGRDVAAGNYDVLVTDGFTGNVVLKLMEGLSSTLFSIIKEELQKSANRKIGGMLVRPAFKDIKKSMDYAEYGGAPLVGVKGISIICHGSSNAKAIKNAIKVAEKCLKGDFVAKINQALNKNNEKKQDSEDLKDKVDA